MIKKIFILFTLSCSVVVAFGKTIKIGVLLENKKPGLMKTDYSSNFFRAIKIAKKSYDKELKEAGINIEFKIYELIEDRIKNYQVIKKSIDDKVDVVIGPSVSFYLPNVYFVLKDIKNPPPVVTPYGDSSLVSTSSFITSMRNMNVSFGKILQHFLKNNFKTPKILIVCALDVEVSRSQCDSIPSSLKKKATLVDTDQTVSNIDVIKKIVKKGNFNVIVTTDRIPVAGTLIRDLTADGFKGTFIGSSSLGEVKATGLLDVTKTKEFKAIGLREFSSHNIKTINKGQKKVVEALIEPWGAPRLTSLLFYDATSMVIEAILSYPQKFKKMILQNDFHNGILAKRKDKGMFYNAISIKRGVYSHIGQFQL